MADKEPLIRTGQGDYYEDEVAAISPIWAFLAFVLLCLPVLDVCCNAT